MFRWVVWAHKWLGLIVGVQVILWVVSGLFMSAVPIETVRGEHNIQKAEAAVLSAGALAPLSAILTGAATRAELFMLNGAPAWRIDRGGKPDSLVDARTGQVLSPLPAGIVVQIAKADFSGRGDVVGVTLIDKDPPIEYRSALPVWQVRFNDPDDTRLYVSPVAGKVVARRSQTWRIYDFLWSLHIMDYRGRDDFNHPLIVIAATLALVMSLTGAWIVVVRFRPRKWR